MVPLEAASKHSNGCMIWPPASTSIRNRPPLVSSTIFASSSAVRCTSIERGHAVDIRHWTFGCAMTLGASTMRAAAVAANRPLAVAMNLRRSVVTVPSSSRHQLMVGALGHVVPRAYQRLELRERGVHLSGRGCLLRLFPDDRAGELLQLSQHRDGDREHLD